MIHRILGGLKLVLPDLERPPAQLEIVAENTRSTIAEIEGVQIAPDGQMTGRCH